jgi:hypothetical protein
MIKELKLIAKKAYTEGIYTLSGKETSIYFNGRIKKLLGENPVISRYELTYRLCEVGPGKIRFDPDLIDSILNTSFIKNDDSLSFLTQSGYLFFLNLPLENNFAKNIISSKIKALDSIKKDLNDKNLKKKTIEIIKKSFDSDIKCKNAELLDNAIQLHFSFNNVNFIMKYITTDLWIYPYSQEIWTLYKDSKEQQAFPVLITPRIQGICYSLFKLIGMLAFNPYKIYISSKTDTEIKKIIYPTARRKEFKPGKFEPIEADFKKGNDAISCFFNILNKMSNTDELVKFTKHREKIQNKMDSIGYNFENLDSLKEILDLLPKYKLYKFVENWYLKRKKILQEISGLNP